MIEQTSDRNVGKLRIKKLGKKVLNPQESSLEK